MKEKELSEILGELEIPNEQREMIMNNLSIERLKEQKLSLLVVGGTGVGKSSTINAMFEINGGDRVAKVGVSAIPETMETECYHLNNLTIYDSPGIGDDISKDKSHLEKIKNLLLRRNENNEALIDMVLIIVSAESRDLGSCYTLVEEIMPLLEDKKRILIALNKCDRGGLDSSEYFDYVANKPSEFLQETLEEKSKTIQERIKNSTGIEVEVVYYSAGETRKRDGEKQPSYNLAKLFYCIAQHTPKKKRFIYKINQANNTENFQSNDNKINYTEISQKTFLESLWDNFCDTAVKIIDRVKPVVIEKVTDKILELLNFKKR